MKVKSFSVGIGDGISMSIEKLDEFVKELGNIKIYSIVDTLYPKEVSGEKCGVILTRVIVYE